jgi:anti-sigma B factor antagonist
VNSGEVAQVRHESRDANVIVRIEGDVDAANAAGVLDQVTRVLTNFVEGLVLDLSGTRHLDSAGIQMLLDLDERLRSRGQHLSVYVTREQPLRLTLTLFELERAFPLADSLEEAMAKIESPAESGP